MTPALTDRDKDFVGDSQQASPAKISSGSVRDLSQSLICMTVDAATGGKVTFI